MRNCVAALKIFLFALWCAVMIPLQLCILAVSRYRGTHMLPLLFHRTACRIFGIRVKICGTPVTGTPVLFAGNHLSYLDIPAIGSILPASFVAKSEVRGWPLFGLLARLSQTVFVQRVRQAAGRGNADMLDMLEREHSLVLFAEGTSTNGESVYPFQSSFFDVCIKSGFNVQPFTLRLCAVGRQTITDSSGAVALRDLYAWHLHMDTPLTAHLWRFAKTRGASLDIIFHPPLSGTDFPDRKALAQNCHNIVAGALLPRATEPCG